MPYDPVNSQAIEVLWIMLRPSGIYNPVKFWRICCKKRRNALRKFSRKGITYIEWTAQERKIEFNDHCIHHIQYTKI